MTVERERSESYVTGPTRNTSAYEQIEWNVGARVAALQSLHIEALWATIRAFTVFLLVIILLGVLRWLLIGETVPVTAYPPWWAPLEVVGGGVLQEIVVEESADDPKHIGLSDGSSLVLAPGTVLTPMLNTGRHLALWLSTGRVTVVIVPGGPERWLIGAELFFIDAGSAVFTVERTPFQVEVIVAHGSIEVDGSGLQGEPRMLNAGDSLVVRFGQDTALITGSRGNSGSRRHRPIRPR